MYRVFVAAPQTLERERFWRTVYGYIHSRVSAGLRQPDLSTYACVLAEELDLAWFAPVALLPVKTRDTIFIEAFIPPVPLPSQVPAEETEDPVVPDAAAHSQLMHLALRCIYVEGRGMAIVFLFMAHGFKFIPDHDDIAKMYALPVDKRDRVQLALAWSRPGEITTLRMTEALLRTDNVAQLEAMGRLPLAMDLGHAIEVGAHKVVRRVLEGKRGPGDRVDKTLVQLALEMRDYATATLLLQHTTKEERIDVLHNLTGHSEVDVDGMQTVLDSLPEDEHGKGGTYREAYATQAVSDLLETGGLIIGEHKGEWPPGVQDKFRAAFRMLLSRYNMIDKVYPEWAEELAKFGLEAEILENRRRSAPMMKQRKLQAAKQRAKQRGGRGGRK